MCDVIMQLPYCITLISTTLCIKVAPPGLYLRPGASLKPALIWTFMIHQYNSCIATALNIRPIYFIPYDLLCFV